MIARVLVLVALVVLAGCTSSSSDGTSGQTPVFPPMIPPPNLPAGCVCEPCPVPAGLSTSWSCTVCTCPDASAAIDGGATP
jgi:hypothetical protein